jgi:hypothetical protein
MTQFERKPFNNRSRSGDDDAEVCLTSCWSAGLRYGDVLHLLE